MAFIVITVSHKVSPVYVCLLKHVLNIECTQPLTISSCMSALSHSFFVALHSLNIMCGPVTMSGASLEASKLINIFLDSCLYKDYV